MTLADQFGDIDIYLFDQKQHSLFEDNWLHPTEDSRKSFRAKIEKAGGLNYGGFTDFVSAVKIAASGLRTSCATPATRRPRAESLSLSRRSRSSSA